MIYKIILSNTKDTIPIQEEHVADMLKMMEDGAQNIITPEGAFNPSYYTALLPDYNRTMEQEERLKAGLYRVDLIDGKPTKIPTEPEPYLLEPLGKLLEGSKYKKLN